MGIGRRGAGRRLSLGRGLRPVGDPTPPGFQGVSLPRGMFSGPRDQWYGFTDEPFQELD